jgi:hypothetical protein
MVAGIDQKHDVTELTQRVFHSFPSVYQMLPQRAVFDSLDLYDISNWPTDGIRPSRRSLEAAEAVQKKLATRRESSPSH